jgi:hypothetical protein
VTGTERQWRRDFERASAAIPAHWIWTDTDGWQGIDPAHAGHPLVRHYANLCKTGYARGWL